MAPLNDDFANATDLGSATSGEVTFDITGATIEAGEYQSAFWSTHGVSVWFSYTPPADGVLTLDTSDTPAPRWDSYLDAWTGTTLAGLVLQGSDDDSQLQPGVTTPDGYGTSKLTITVTAGVKVSIRVISYTYAADVSNPSAGYPRSDCKLRWAWAPPPDPDPSISTRSPVQGIAGTVVDLHGSNLDTINHVRFGAADASFTIIDATHVQATVPVTHAASSTVSVVTDTALNPVSSLAFTVLFPGPWTAMPERFGSPVVPLGAWRQSARAWPAFGYVPPAAITGPPDNSVASGTVTTSTAQAAITVSNGVTIPASSPGDVQVAQSVAVVDVQSVWDNDPGGFDYPLYAAMDPHPDADVPALPTDAVTHEWRHPTVTVGTIPDGAVVFGGRYRFHVETNSPGRGTPETSSLHVDLRRVPAGSYTLQPIGSATQLVTGWIFPSTLAAMTSLASYPVTAFTGSVVEATTYDLADSDLDTGRLHALVVTHTEYVAGSAYSAADSTNNGVFDVRIAFRYTPDQYRYLYTKPLTKPPLRQYPRDDALGGTPRQGRHSRSVQASTREGWAGTYR